MSNIISLPLSPIVASETNKRNADFKLALAGTTALLLLIYCGPLLRSADAAAAPVDLGILSLAVLAVFAFLLFISISLWLMGLLWPVFRDYRKYHFSSNFKSLAPWQKIFFYLSTFFLLLYAFVYALEAVL